MSKINNIYEVEKTINTNKVFQKELVNEAIKDNGWIIPDSPDYICMDSDGRYLRYYSDSSHAKVEILHDGAPAIRARIFGILDPDEFKSEAIDNNIAKSPLFLRYDMYDDGCEYIGYIYFKAGSEEQVREVLCSECLPYGLE